VSRRSLKVCMSGAPSVTVSIWPLAVSAARLAGLYAVLSADEQERAGKIKHDSVAREFVASRGITRVVLASACGCVPAEIVLATHLRGKPRLVSPPSPLTFNLSHSGGYCALAVGAFPAIGVDIETRRDTVGDIAKNVFSEREAATYAAVPPAERMRTFFRAWVAKEAYLKATGLGLAGGLKSLELNLTTGLEIDPIAIRSERGSLAKWRFLGFDVSETIVGAVAVETDAPEIELDVSFIDPEYSPRPDA
jgi:4'-phosphopantetheinyl transferase